MYSEVNTEYVYEVNMAAKKRVRSVRKAPKKVVRARKAPVEFDDPTNIEKIAAVTVTLFAIVVVLALLAPVLAPFLQLVREFSIFH